MRLHLQCLIDGREFILSYLIISFEVGSQQIDWRTDKGPEEEETSIGKKNTEVVGERVHGKLTHQGREKSQKMLDRNTLVVNTFVRK